MASQELGGPVEDAQRALPEPGRMNPCVDKGKGKGKASDDVGVQDEQQPESSGTRHETASDAAITQAKDDLALTARIDPDTVAKLVELDRQPSSTLPTTTKLIKAISILTRAYTTHLDSAVGTEAASVAGLSLNTYGAVLELVSSALSDVATTCPDLSSAPRNKPRDLEEYSLNLARARFGLPLENAVPPAPASSDSDPPATIVVYDGFDFDVRTSSFGRRPPPPPSELALVFAENARLALAQLRPPALFPPVRPSRGADDVLTPGRTRQRPVGPAPIAKLPQELLVHIFRYARDAAAVSTDGESSTSSARDDFLEGLLPGLARRTGRDHLANDGLSGSPSAAQRFTLALSTVCRAWGAPARAVAFERIHLLHGHQLARLARVLASPRSALRPHVASIRSITAVLSPEKPTERPAPVPSSSGRPSFENTVALPLTPSQAALHALSARLGSGSSAAAATSSSSSSGANGPRQGDETAGELWSRIVALAENVQDLNLVILPRASRWRGMMARAPLSTEYLDEAVLNTLSGTRTLKSLQLAFNIDFDELEMILNGLPNLEFLTVRAIDVNSNQAVVPSPTAHAAKNLKYFKLGEPIDPDVAYARIEPASLRASHLCWLLEPAVSNGTLNEVHLHVAADRNGMRMPAGAVPVGGPNVPGGPFHGPPFATGEFADLVVRAGASLERLTLQDVAESGSASASFAQPPHSMSFDFALTHLSSLTELSLSWMYTGPAFLTALQSLRSFRSLSLSGTPVHTTAEALSDALESSFDKLEKLTISGQYAGVRGGRGGWNGAGLRKVKQVARDRGLGGAFVG